jgi:16S rRNA (cytidine1402-2'-O)-methyltransferase
MRPAGRLVLVATPIGNLSDLSPRAVEELRAAAVVCCEDSRHTGRLLQHAGIHAARLMVVNDHTESERVPEVLERLAAGETVAVVTDAGTPGISDPGERLVRAAADAGHEVSAVPGPAALIVALVTSGMATGRFVFEGFLPRSGAERAARLAAVAAERRTVILYEAPHRLARTLADLATACGADRRIAIARELTKLHEEIWRGSLGEATARAADRAPIGEHVLVIHGAPPPAPADDAAVRDAVRCHLDAGATVRDAAAAAAAELGIPKRRAYDLALAEGRARP